MQGRRPHWTFRGLLNFHSHYGLSARRVATATRLSRRLRRFRLLHRRSDSYRLERPSCRVGVAPTEDQHLFTAHISDVPFSLPFPSPVDVESRCGAVGSGRLLDSGLVTTPRSSNWTGGFPASSFRTRRSKWLESHVRPQTAAALGPLELVQLERPSQVVVRVSCLTLTLLYLELRAQPPTHPIADVAVDAAVGLADGSDAEIVGPTP
jgi:hypothetical protein